MIWRYRYIMKTVIFAGGLGSRLSEETGERPKPMVEIGGKPILWHIMKIYSYYGFHEFIVLTGYLSHVIKDYFINYYTRYSDITVDMQDHRVTLHTTREEPWRVTMLYTGEQTMTGARLKKAEAYLKGERFLLTYGDGLSTINIPELIAFHKKSGKIATLTAVQPEGKFGALGLTEDGVVTSFREKPRGDGVWINGGFMVLEPGIFDYIDGDQTVFEQEPLNRLAANHELCAYRHEGFWKCMDSQREKMQLEEMWATGNAPWKIW